MLAVAALSSQLGWQQVCFKAAAADGVGVAAVPCSAVAQAGRQPAGPSGKIITLLVSWHQQLSCCFRGQHGLQFF